MQIYLCYNAAHPCFTLSRRHWSVWYLKMFNDNLEEGSGCKKLLKVWETLDEVVG